jgi:outer membrane protein assembly factor BamB
VALRTADGSTAWRLPGASQHVTVAGDLVYVQQGTEGRRTLSALRPADGAVQWTANIGHSIQALTVADGVGYMLGSDHEVVGMASVLQAFDVRTGAERWSRPGVLNLSNYPLLDPTSVYVGGVGVIWALDRTSGATLWQRALPPDPRPSARALAGGRLVVRGGGGSYGLDPTTGDIVWTLAAPDVPYVTSEAAVAGDTLLTSCNGVAPAFVRAVKAADGTPVWKTSAPIVPCHVMVSGPVAYATGGATVDALNVADGTVRWRYQLGDTALAEAVAADGLVFAATTGGRLHAINAG